ncbi:MAG: TIGR04283 family arsenosugar biosynthesis glycosyltransferase [Oceanococcus sp.]
MKTLSVIIPTLNEQVALAALLEDLRQQKGVALQIIVADGGSQDETRQVAQSTDWVQASRGRGAQMNAARHCAQHATVLFLHADSRLADEHLLSKACSALDASPPCSAGHFALRFKDAPAQGQRFYRHLQAKSRLNRAETINGDQGLLISCEFFDHLGGFDESLPFLEDQRISQEIFKQGQWLLLPGELATSARRFEQEGRGARYFLMMIIMCAHTAGMESFFERARDLYPEQADTNSLKVSPFLELILQLGQEQANFWPCMADYTLDNAWQIAFVVDQYLGSSRVLAAYDRIQGSWPRRVLRPLLALSLKHLFSGPVLQELRRREAS